MTYMYVFQSYERTEHTLTYKLPLLFFLLKIKGNNWRSKFCFVFVLPLAGPTFYLGTKIKVLCQVLDYAL